MSSDYIKHLIDCHCILSIYKNRTKPVYHKFVVFSELKEDIVKEKYVLCNNCDIVHKVIDVNKSEIKWGNEGYRSLVTTIEDIKFNLESQGLDRLVTILEVNNIDLSDWEYIEYLLENNLEGKVVLDKKEIENSINYKYIEVKNGKYKIKNDIVQRYL
tara:strand:- start:262 stop:735 length:474 start_codon:yes stop_codon:yes gene_type:complete